MLWCVVFLHGDMYYHTIHSADKWFFNPFIYEEPEFHEPGMDNPDNPCSVEFSNEELLEYLYRVKEKTIKYLDSLTDEELNECPPECPHTRLELVLMQFSHISAHIGFLNGQTIERTGRFPLYVGSDTLYKLEKSLYDE